MRRLVPVIIILAIVAGVIVYTFNRNRIPDAPPPPAPPPSQVEQPQTNKVSKPEVDTTAEQTEPTEPEEPKLADQPITEANWDDKLNDLLGDGNVDEDVKADKIADWMPKLSEKAQTELAGHLVNLVRDEDYAKAAAILKNEKTPAPASKILLDDLFNRDHSLMLPLVLDVAKNQNHPLKSDAKEMLEMVIQEDHGDNWEEWSKSVDKTLKGE